MGGGAGIPKRGIDKPLLIEPIWWLVVRIYQQGSITVKSTIKGTLDS